MSASIIHEPNVSMDDQLTRLLEIEDGWNGPSSKAIDPENLELARKVLTRHWLPDMPIPFVFPMENGGVNLEWFIGNTEHGLEIDFETNKCLWEWWNSKEQREFMHTFDLADVDSWRKLQKESTGERPTKEINYGFGGPI